MFVPIYDGIITADSLQAPLGWPRQVACGTPAPTKTHSTSKVCLFGT